jgi:hypothetical protein
VTDRFLALLLVRGDARVVLVPVLAVATFGARVLVIIRAIRAAVLAQLVPVLAFFPFGLRVLDLSVVYSGQEGQPGRRAAAGETQSQQSGQGVGAGCSAG